MQFILFISIGSFGYINVENNIYLLVISLVFIGFIGATYDIAMEAYRIELFSKRNVAIFNGQVDANTDVVRVPTRERLLNSINPDTETIPVRKILFVVSCLVTYSKCHAPKPFIPLSCRLTFPVVEKKT